jgi:hypothetical protein
MKNLKKSQSVLEYICVCIVFASVGVGTLFIMANRTAGLWAATAQTEAITSNNEAYGGKTTLPQVDTDNPPPPTNIDGETADERLDSSHPEK